MSGEAVGIPLFSDGILVLSRYTTDGEKIKINDELYEKTRRIVEELGYASVDEFVTHVLEREVNPPAWRMTTKPLSIV